MLTRKLPNETRFDRYFLMFDACALLFLALVAAEFAGYERGFVSVVTLIWAALLLGLFSRRRRDEFAEHCWQRATSATFVMLVATPFFLVFGAGFVDGLTGAEKTGAELSLEGLVTILFATFYGVFEWTRFRGGR